MSGPREFKNRKAFHEFDVLEKVEAGVVLRGTEVKALREGKINFADSYARLDGGELYLVACHISEYKNAGAFTHDPVRRRKLLLHKVELRKLARRVEEKGLTIVPLRLFFNERGYAKVELGVGRGKKGHDKRQALKSRETEREIRREMTRHGS